jgi:DNA transformation protein
MLDLEPCLVDMAFIKIQKFGLIAYDELYFKVTEDNLSDYELAGSHPFVYTGHKKPITMSYWLVPPDVLEDSSIIMEWANKAYQAALKNKKTNN